MKYAYIDEYGAYGANFGLYAPSLSVHDHPLF